mgnify:CR=1 FL=1
MMKITDVKCELLKMPLPRPMQSGSSSGTKGGPVGHIYMPLAIISTDSGITGTGYGWTLLGGATAIRCIIQDDFSPLLIGEDPLDNERLWTKLNKRLQTVGRTGVVNEAQAAVDLALWDIKGKALNVPIYQLLGGKVDGPNDRQLRQQAIAELVYLVSDEAARDHASAAGVEDLVVGDQVGVAVHF